ncbi:MAG: glycosyltransferase family 4 protein [Polyangiaceae bacterium]|nr:glycosyltransferase family 4 protein [Polyangiaceae bacterium]
MKIVVLHPRLGATGGAELLLVAQAHALRRAGHDVELSCFSWDEEAWRARVDGLPIRSLDEPAWLRPIETAFAPSPRRRAFVERAVAGADLVIAHNAPASALAGAVAGRRAVWYCHEPPRLLYPRETQTRAFAARSWRPGAGALARGMALTGLREAVEARVGGPWARLREFDRRGVAALGAVIANSRLTAAAVREIYGRACDAVVPPMVDDRGAPSRPSGVSPAPRVLCQSRLALEKNTEGALLGFARFAACRPGATLTIVGDGALRARLERRARGLHADVRFVGHLDARALDRARDQAEVFLAVPFDEPFGMVFVEAALRGLLVVASDHGGPAEIFDDGAMAELCDPASPRAIAAALARLTATPAEALDARRLRAAEAMRARYVPAVIEPRFVELIEALGR